MVHNFTLKMRAQRLSDWVMTHMTASCARRNDSTSEREEFLPDSRLRQASAGDRGPKQHFN